MEIGGEFQAMESRGWKFRFVEKKVGGEKYIYLMERRGRIELSYFRTISQ